MSNSQPSSLAIGLLSKGYSFPCSYCQRMWAASSRGEESCASMVPDGKHCAGPMSGMSFPQYKGPLTKEFIASHCFRCGTEKTSATILGKDGGVGVCEKHEPLVSNLVPEQRLRRKL